MWPQCWVLVGEDYAGYCCPVEDGETFMVDSGGFSAGMQDLTNPKTTAWRQPRSL